MLASRLPGLMPPMRTRQALAPLEDVVIVLHTPPSQAPIQLYCKVIETSGTGPFDSVLVVTALAQTSGPQAV